jgi:hypothetical protein
MRESGSRPGSVPIPAEHAGSPELATVLRQAVTEVLSERQRRVFVAMSSMGYRWTRWPSSWVRRETRSRRYCSMRAGRSAHI